MPLPLLLVHKRRVNAPANPQFLDPGLYIVATPIGNLGDVTARAARILAACDGIACEDSRVTAKLLRHLGLSKPLWRYDDHSNDADRQKLLERAKNGPVALVSDAGMPLISDPGFRLVRDARKAGIAVTAAPGASATILALALSGLPSDRFLFAGFLPGKEKARQDVLEELRSVRATLIFFDGPSRLTASLAAVAALFPRREICVARELTKLHEDVRTGFAADLLAHYEAHPPRGEIVLLIGPPDDSEGEPADVDGLLREALADHKPSQAAALVAKATGMDRKALYARALELRSQ